MTMDRAIIDKMNKLGKDRIPFLFIIDFLGKKPLIHRLNNIDSDSIIYSINGKTNCAETPNNSKRLSFSVFPVKETLYVKAFNKVQTHIRHGDTFLLNLTMPSKLKSNYTLKDIFFASKAKYKLWLKDHFVVFSPEIFIQTKGTKINSFPMKGTINANIPNAKDLLLNSEKENAEHFTIVDLIRNDLSMVAKDVEVEEFKTISKIVTNNGELLQMSSKVTGQLPKNYNENIGDILSTLLPAGSISGAPKKKTLEIIKEAEKYDRGYYTGVFGVFDGTNIDSGVMIRFVEQTNSELIYKSGGGITSKSIAKDEYDELVQKVYVPI